jgi:hypothetical protein
VRIFLLFPATLTRGVSGRSRPLRAGFPTGTHRCRSSEEVYSLLGWRACVYCERRTLPQKLWLSFEALWALSFVNPNTWHLICNNFNLNFVFGIVCLCVCVCAFSLHRESPDMILGDEPLISEVILSQMWCDDIMCDCYEFYVCGVCWMLYDGLCNVFSVFLKKTLTFIGYGQLMDHSRWKLRSG